MINNISKNLEHICQGIAPHKPVIIAVTKYGDTQSILSAYDAGLRDFAESRVVEAVQKIGSLPDNIRKTSRFHFIGHLQTNKAKIAVATFDFIHSVDSLHLAKIISDISFALGKTQAILLQVNNANEPQKFGFSKQDLFASFSEINSLPGIRVLGLMCIAPLNYTKPELESLFKDIANIKTQLEIINNVNLPELSMGMSNDYIQAAHAGATMLRIGSKLFS